MEYARLTSYDMYWVGGADAMVMALELNSRPHADYPLHPGGFDDNSVAPFLTAFISCDESLPESTPMVRGYITGIRHLNRGPVLASCARNENRIREGHESLVIQTGTRPPMGKCVERDMRLGLCRVGINDTKALGSE